MLKFKKTICVSLLLLMSLLVVNLTTAQAGVRTVLSPIVPAYRQSGTYLCWATRAAMIISYFKGETANNRDVEIAKAKFKASYDQPAAIEDTRDAVKNYTNISGSIQNNSLSYTAVQYQINNKGPIGVRTWPKVGDVGHALVIKGYDTNTNAVIYNDPADGLGHSDTYSYVADNTNWTWNGSLFYK